MTLPFSIPLLKKWLKSKEKNVLSKLLGMTIHDDGRSLKLDECDMIEQLLNDFNIQEFNPVVCLLPSGNNLILMRTNLFSTMPPHKLLSTIQISLLYLSCTTQPEITDAVKYLSSFMPKLSKPIWIAKNVLHNIKRTIILGITYKKKVDSCVIAFFDSDWGCER